MKINKLFSLLVILALLLAAMPVMPAGAAGTITVQASNVGVDWFTNDTRSGGASSFVSGPGAAPLGQGSLQFTTTDAFTSSNAKAQLFNYSYIGANLSDLDGLSYWAYRSSASTNSTAQTISLNLEVDYVGDGSTYTTLVFEPVYQPGGVGAMQVDTWQLWDAFNSGNGKWWSTKAIPGVPNAFTSYVTWNTIVTNNPDAKVKLGLGFNVGSGWAGQFSGAVDELLVNFSGDATTYDFEPTPPDTAGPLTTNVLASLNPAAINSSVTVTANVDDTTTGGSIITSAEYSLDNGATWSLMTASDGAFNDASEDVTVNFMASATPGVYDLCVRGTDAAGNVGVKECTMFVVYDPSGGFVTGGGWIDSPVAQTIAGFNTIPDPLAGNYPSQPYQAQQTAEFGDHIRLAGTDRLLNSVMITMSSWACQSGGWTTQDCVTAEGAGYTHPLTLNIYAVDDSGGTPATGALLATVTQDTFIPFRPSANPACTTNGGWGANCFSGYAFNVTFDMSALNLVLPDEIIYGLAFNTQTWGYNPIGVDGPYTSLNFALVRPNIDTWEQIGVDVDPDAVFWNTMTAGYYADGGAAGVGVLRHDTGWTGYVPAARFYVTSEGAYKLDPSLGGKATFGFVSKYRRGATVPDGNTEFKFVAGGLNFSSTSYQWLVVNQGGANAQFKGNGTINGQGNYGFMLWAGDGSPDTFRIQIWDATTEVVVYDNGVAQTIGGGSIVVHRR